jgi:hypothetical protein
MAGLLFASVSSASDDEGAAKRKLNGNMTLEYTVLPPDVSTLGEMFSQGVVYGRVRANLFTWDWDDENWDATTGKGRLNHTAMGIGGSLIYKSGIYNGVSFTGSYYGSMNPPFFGVDENEVGGVKAGKDVFSRYKVSTDGDFGLYAPGENYFEFNNGIIDVILGRQLYESVFTSSNDTKMIPNTFDGASLCVKITP